MLTQPNLVMLLSTIIETVTHQIFGKHDCAYYDVYCPKICTVLRTVVDQSLTKELSQFYFIYLEYHAAVGANLICGCA